MKIQTCALALTLAGCVSTSDVVPTSNGSYLIAGRATGGLNSGKGLIEAIKQANRYCKNQGKTMVAHDSKNAPAGFGGESAQFIFSCESH